MKVEDMPKDKIFLIDTFFDGSHKLLNCFV